MKRMTTVLRELMAGEKVLVYPGVYDPLTARIAERLGFKVVGLPGNSLGSHLCTSEPLLCLPDLVRQTRYITDAINIPLKVDADAGFGEPLHVMRTIRDLEQAGAAGAQIEDQIFPKRAHYHQGLEHTTDAELMVEKIKAAVAARRDPDFVIFARTDAMLTHSFDEGVRRANLYLEAGADMAHVYPNSVEQTRLAPKEIKGPVVCGVSDGNRKGRPILSVQELSDMGYKMISFPNAAIMAVAMAVKDMLETLKATGRTGLNQAEAFDVRKYVEETIGLEEMYKIERETVGI
jgi:2-methylisocitrate lyase-like PEP mutase family enzyme